jgi:hypothetical protein
VKFARVPAERTDTAIVPRKHEVPVGTLRSILNQAGIENQASIENQPSIEPGSWKTL